MRQELDEALCAKYPKLFVDRHASMKVTAMCWGFTCGDGWYQIVDELCDKIQKVCDREGFQVKAVQVKEKFGTLRFYTDRGNDEIWGLTSEACKKSAVTCERCGKPGKLVGWSYLYCACPEHTEDEDKHYWDEST